MYFENLKTYCTTKRLSNLSQPKESSLTNFPCFLNSLSRGTIGWSEESEINNFISSDRVPIPILPKKIV